VKEPIQSGHERGCPKTHYSSSNRPEMRQFWLETSGQEIHMFLGNTGSGAGASS